MIEIIQTPEYIFNDVTRMIVITKQHDFAPLFMATRKISHHHDGIPADIANFINAFREKPTGLFQSR